MSKKSIISLARDFEKNKPVYKAMRKVQKWYEEHKITPYEISSKISKLHDLADEEAGLMNQKHSEELMPILTEVNRLQEEARKLGKKHAEEREDMTTGFAQTELDLLQGKIKDIPERITPIPSRPGKLWYFLKWLLPKPKGPAKLSTQSVDSQVSQ